MQQMGILFDEIATRPLSGTIKLYNYMNTIITPMFSTCERYYSPANFVINCFSTVAYFLLICAVAVPFGVTAICALSIKFFDKISNHLICSILEKKPQLNFEINNLGVLKFKWLWESIDYFFRTTLWQHQISFFKSFRNVLLIPFWPLIFAITASVELIRYLNATLITTLMVSGSAVIFCILALVNLPIYIVDLVRWVNNKKVNCSEPMSDSQEQLFPLNHNNGPKAMRVLIQNPVSNSNYSLQNSVGNILTKSMGHDENYSVDERMASRIS
ncbi:MAG TPA: hypothetical protein PK657_00895 [Legionella sp.]|nr:hypothetical protein [Legionella sp.]